MALSAAGLSAVLLTAGKTDARYVAHEWGTFTSVQGADGALLDWKPLESSLLPKFVYNWANPGLNRRPTSALIPGKGRLLARQRMETPVIYFYSDRKQTVDVSVHFPQGLITEWYPQAARIGPSTVAASPWVAKFDDYAHRAGISPGFSFLSLGRNAGTKDSQANWSRVEILPSGEETGLAGSLPMDRSGSHYFAARDTKASLLRLQSIVSTNPLPEYEKFLFYRGVGNFSTPLRVTMESNETVTLSNEGQEPIAHLFVLAVQNHAGSYVFVPGLHPGEKRRVNLSQEHYSVESLSHRLGAKLAASLEREGLYPEEASAMVNTWKDSWLEEEGVRVLYVLPRAWTDRTLPLALDPAPHELNRVMVGRAEILTTALEQRLAGELTKAEQGDAVASDNARAELWKLGRFAEPALRLALEGSSLAVNQTAWALFQSAAKPSVTQN